MSRWPIDSRAESNRKLAHEMRQYDLQSVGCGCGVYGDRWWI